MSEATVAPLEERLAGGAGAWGVSFTVGGRLHACDALLVEEVLDQPSLRPLPDMPHHVAGILSVRGSLLPVLDLARLLAPAAEGGGAGESPPSEAERAGCAVLLLAIGEHRVGVRVEGTGGVLFLDPAAVRLATPAERERSPGLLGVARTEAGLLTILDPVAMLERR
jgi:purine-binding chemotaxis protein CheW